MSHKIKFWLTTCGKRARVCLWQQFHACLEQLATKTDILTSTASEERWWQSHSWQRELEKLWECYGNKIRRVLSRMDKHRERERVWWLVRLRKAMAASSFLSYQNREWWWGEASSAAEKKRRTSINFGQQTNQPLAPYCLKTASILSLYPQSSA